MRRISRWAAILVGYAIVALACPSAGQEVVSAPARAPVLDAGSPRLRRLRPPLARPVTPGAHVLLLPHEALGDGASLPLSSLARGEMPGTAFPAGTVYVARAEAGDAYVTEWDLARGAARRRVKLEVPPGESSLRIRRIGDVLHVLAWGHPGRLLYVRLTLDLHALAPPELLGEPSGAGPGPIVGDAQWTLILFEGVPAYATKPDGAGYYAVSYDAAGARIAERMLASHPPLPHTRDVAAILGAYALVPAQAYGDCRVAFVRLSPTLRIDRAALYGHCDSEHSEGLRAMFRWQDQVYVDGQGEFIPSDFDTGSFAPELPVTSVACGLPDPGYDADVDLWLRGEHLTLRGDNVDDWLEWTDGSAAPLPGSCTGIHRDE
jgi:hypothetical protein